MGVGVGVAVEGPVELGRGGEIRDVVELHHLLVSRDGSGIELLCASLMLASRLQGLAKQTCIYDLGCHSVTEVVERMTKLAYLTATGEVGTLGANWGGVSKIEGGPWSQKPVLGVLRRSGGGWKADTQDSRVRILSS